MTPRLARLTAKELIRILKRKGFVCIGQSGSHAHFEHPISGRFTTVPVHSGKIIGPGLLKTILRQTGLNPDELGD